VIFYARAFVFGGGFLKRVNGIFVFLAGWPIVDVAGACLGAGFHFFSGLFFGFYF